MTPLNSTNTGWLPLWSNGPESSSPQPQHLLARVSSKAQAQTGENNHPAKTVKLRSSTTSLASMTTGNWLGWSSRPDNSKRLRDEDENENNEEENENQNDHDEITNSENNEDDYAADDNGDEIDDHVLPSRRKSTWSFWNSDKKELNDKESKPKQDKESKPKQDAKKIIKDATLTNTIVNSTPSVPPKEDYQNPPQNTSIDSERDEDDAVLYKPHDKPNQFKQINTHKNENLKQNIIVPDWNYCLPPQHSSTSTSLSSSIFGTSSTANTGSLQKNDMKNWRNFLNQLSSKLGFSSQSLTSVVDSKDEPDTDESKKVEKEFNVFYEKTYKLYGRSLAKLPGHKRACLPNYNKYYTKAMDNEEETYKFQQQTQLEEDANDPNAISITNDPMGNLLINHKSQKRQQHPAVSASDIVSQRAGPLRKIKKILIIGVHGFFPTKMIRPLIGAPKGTSLKFANEAEKAIIRYCVENNLINDQENTNVSIQKIALEKEGKIFDRVQFYTEILTKWRKELNNADFIFVASHSQGTVVSIMLLAKLIKMGILTNAIHKRIGLLGMAGINNGPFYGIDKTFFIKAYSAIEHESMMELFELTKFDSEQSLVYKESLQIIINANVKICFVGSINDQLVPLYSALASHIFHPNIFRAAYIDHSSQTPDFICKLVSLCCHLQNIGYFDNNVLKELSTVLAGPLTGGGHSKIYNDGKVYDMGIKFVLDTDDVVIPPTETASFFSKDISLLPTHTEMAGYVTSGIGTYGSVETPESIAEIVKIPVTNQVYIKEYNIGKIGSNPFILPWCLRGLIFNIEKNWPNSSKYLMVDSGKALSQNGYDEVRELYELFDRWKPESKVLKDLKFRLNGIRASKL